MNWGISLMYWVSVLSVWKNSKSHVTRVKLWRRVLSYVWDICLMYWGISLMNWGISLMYWGISLMYWVLVLSFWKNSKSHVTRVQLWRSVLSYVWDICLMYGILVLCMGY